ncbi:guanine deaminase [cf. Phormidesmis sp. LEGE 11477]|uniref:guanine deaminase n=1 Tax=cf. Phormidesmis sp. LEGE 11477 TaxID=1828680 RepID=UPI0018806D97|nr:guanine deaminase [cf. Phormidesmis sp. LEGE 11477]MBE9059631.1 guanine deaminase [cf. Phormidesmis sp. LEGE 11477]
MGVLQNQSNRPQLKNQLKAIRGAFLDFVDDPFYVPEAESVRYLPDGLLVLENGKIKAFGPYEELQAEYGDIPITIYADRLIMPGFIDTHIHYPQTGIIAAYGEQLLEWLNQYIFPTEGKFKDKDYARAVAEIFLDQLLRNGTTTALVFATVFPQSVDAFFEAAERRNLCMIAGKVMMDRNAPKAVCDTAESSYQETKALIQKWHKKGRLRYAVTPRFAITSTDEQLQKAGDLLREFPDVYLHTHISENLKEVAWVKELFPNCSGYLDAYDQAGLVKERSVFAHGVHLSDAEFQRLSEAKSAIAFCPTSNLFLGSGLFNIEQAKSSEYPVKVGLGTDVGAGTSFSLLQTANEAYKVAQLRQQKLSPFEALFLATLGGAKALCLEDSLGSFDVGKEADFIVLNLRSTPLMAFRNSAGVPTSLGELSDRVFSLIMMGDDRAIEAVHILGELAYEQTATG